MSNDKHQNRDEITGKIVKVEQPDPMEMIDPYLYKYMGRAVNYDRRWVGTMILRGTEGCWCTAPFARANMGDEAKKLYLRLKEEGTITWKEEAFFFTHAEGKAAANHYVGQVLAGKIKANKRSWGPHFDAKKGVISSRFYRMVTPEMADKAGFEIREAQAFENAQAQAGVWFEDLEDAYPDLYQKKTTSTYVNKEKKLEMIQEAVSTIKSTGETPTLAAIAEITGMRDEEIAKLVAGEKARLKAIEEAETPVVIEAPEMSFEDEDPSESDITAETEDITALSEDEEDDEDILIEAEASDEDDLTAEIDAEDREAKVEEIATAATSATESMFDFDLAEETVTETPEVIAETKIQEPETAPEDLKTVTARVFVDSSMEKIHTDCESVGWKGDDKEQHQAFLVEIPNYREMWLEPGINLIGNHITGEMYRIDVVIGEE